jgi:DNA processing protein
MVNPMDWVAVSALSGVGPATCQRLRQGGWDAARICGADSETWRWLGLNTKAQAELTELRAGRGRLYQLQQHVADWLQRYADAHLLAVDSEHYPSLLKNLPDAPPVLYVRGSADRLHLPQIALVGSRNASQSGIRHARAFATALSRAGLIVTSGMAHGIDAAAHQAAVNLCLPTVAVFGTGPDVIYPAANRILAAQILEHGGCLVSELPPGSPPLAHHFPLRNRIISGLSAGVLVVEAAPRSGSLITARQALEQGREVFALPGAPGNPMSRGCHDLIRQGAQLVVTVEHILEQLAPLLGAYLPVEDVQASPSSDDSLDTPEATVLAQLDYDGSTLEQLSDGTGMDVSALTVALTGLELKGLIERRGVAYCRI